jgi:dimethylaniline monooxygenase (N-oxide forming)
MDMVRDGRFIHIHRASVRSFSKGKIHFSDGQIVPCDAAVFATGWQINQPTIFGPSLLPDLGLPFDLKNEDPETAKYWNTLDQASKSKLRPLFPMLANLPPEVVEYDLEHNRPVTTTPFRLFRGMVPPKLAARGDRSLIMLGLLINTNVPIYAEVSSLWGIAYLENLPFSPLTSYMLSDERAMNEDISLLEEWNVLRFRDKAAKYLDGSIEIQSFTDLLMKDMGLRSDRKKWAAERGGKRGIFGLRTWVKEWFTPYRGMDYRGMVEEYKTTWGLQGGLV